MSSNLAKKRSTRVYPTKQGVTDHVANTFLQGFDPQSSEREKRKLHRRLHPRSKKDILYDECGVLMQTGTNICDCLQPDCPGCHFPCSKCGSNKCGHECRNHRRWMYDSIENEGTDTVMKNPTALRLSPRDNSAAGILSQINYDGQNKNITSTGGDHNHLEKTIIKPSTRPKVSRRNEQTALAKDDDLLSPRGPAIVTTQPTKGDPVLIIPEHISQIMHPYKLNFLQIRAFNDYWSAQTPHCSVCTAFASSKDNCRMPSDWIHCKPIPLPESTPLFIPPALLALNPKNYEVEDNDVLLRCQVCHVTVHRTCYRISELPSNRANWKCDKCKRGLVSERCNICLTGGGALRKTKNKVWAHIVCAILQPDASFQKPCDHKYSIIDPPIHADDRNQKCIYCASDRGYFVRCHFCCAILHPTCGLWLGARFDIQEDDILKINITCHKHRNTI